MKKKLFYTICFAVLLLMAACTKKEEPAPTPTPSPMPTSTPAPTPTPTPSPTPTPTPIPENLALTALKDMSNALDFLASYTLETTIDYSKGVGYDMTMELSLGAMLMQQPDLAEFKSLGMNGFFDIKEVLAGNCVFYLNDSELLTAHIFTDYTTLLFNLPKYSSQYASCQLQELIDSSTEEDEGIDWKEDSGSSVTSLWNTPEVIRTNTTIDSANISTNEDILALINTYFERFTECFQPETEIKTNASIGTGAYTLTGECHTIKATAADLQAVVDAMAADPRTPAELAEELKAVKFDDFNYFIANYYTNKADSYAWEISLDKTTASPVIFISTPAGFCLYKLEEDGTADIAFYSTTTSKGAGVITIPAKEEGSTNATIDYLVSENNISLDAVFDTTQLVLDYALINDVVKYNFSITTEGFTVSMEQTGTTEHTTSSVTLALFGAELATLKITGDMRDYCEIPVPQDTIDLDTWSEQADLEALAADLLAVLDQYPTLKSMILGDDTSAEGGEEENGESLEDNWGVGSSFLPDENYYDAFMGMTGYYMDETGYVSFEPLEEEVFALGVPSTGFDTIPLSEQAKSDLIQYAAQLFSNSYEEIYPYYLVDGSTRDNTVYSYYYLFYDYYDNTNFDNSITLVFDAVSGELSSIYCYHDSAEDAVKMANEALKLIGINYTATTDIIDNFDFYGNCLIEGYFAEEYYTIEIEFYTGE